MGKKISKILGLTLLTLTLIAGGFLLYITLTDYKPKEIVEIVIHNNKEQIFKQGTPFTVTTFNIGYAGLDKNQDFFMDGGAMSRSSSEGQTRTNLEALTSFMQTIKSDLFILQEVDIHSSRSNQINQSEYIYKAMPDYSNVFATNYKVPWVPVPILNPMGSVQSGLLTLSAFKSTSNYRFDLPGKENWPRQQLDLDRAFIESRFPVDNGKELVMINLHLSAFDKGGKIRKQQLDYLSAHIKKEYQKGSYIILGGDWNHVLPGTDPQLFKTTQPWPEWLQLFPKDFQPDGFKWVIDHEVPTVRTLDVPYSEGTNFRAIIDGFLISPNIQMSNVQGDPLSFENSDHNPVTARLILQ